MIRLNKTIGLTCLVVSLLAGCSQSPVDETTSQLENTDSHADSVQTASASNETSPSSSTDDSESDLNFLQKLSLLIDENPSAAELVNFMDNNLDQSAEDEADIALSRLIHAQNVLSSDWNNMLFDGRSQGFNDMGHEWTLSHLEKIEDPSLRQVYQNLFDSKSRVMTYEESPIVETDWDSMKTYKEHVSKAASLMIDINSKMQNYTYGAHPHDFNAMIKDLVLLEQALELRQSDYLSHIMNKSYNQLVGEIFYSVEGTNMAYWNTPDGPLHLALKSVVQSHPQTDIAKLSQAFLEGESTLRGSDDYYNSLSALLSGHNPFGLQSTMRFNQVTKTNKNVQSTIAYLSCPQKSNVEAKINEAIDQGVDKIMNQLSWDTDQDGRLDITSYSVFTSTKYFATTLFASYTDSQGKFSYTDYPMMFNLQTGEKMQLQDLVENPSINIEGKLLDLIKEKYGSEHEVIKNMDHLPDPLDFQIDDYGLNLYLNKSGDLSPDYDMPFSVYLVHSELVGLYDVIQLYE